MPISQTINPMVNVPSLADLPNFEANVDYTLNTGLQTRATEMNTFASQANALATEVNVTAAALTLNATTDTSTTSNTIGTGSKTFTVTAGKSFIKGMWLLIADTAAPTVNSILAQVDSYSGSTLIVVVPTNGVYGSGTKTAWSISQSSPANPNTDTASRAETNAIGSFRNRLLNGDFAIDQEFVGASTTVTAGAALKYVIDGWYAYCTGANVTFQTTTVAGRKRARFTGLAGNTGVGFAQRIEAGNTADIAQKFASISMLLSSTSITNVNWGLYYANTTNTFGTVASPTRTTIQTGSFTINSTESAYSAITSAILASGATTGLELVITVGALLGSQTLTIGDVQLEKGSIVSPVFDIVHPDSQRSRCYRFMRSIDTAVGFTQGATAASLMINHDNMFTTPTPSATAALVITQPGISAYTQSSAQIAAGGGVTANGGDYSVSNFTGMNSNVGIIFRGGSGGKIVLKAYIP